jgi:hypothetical protein
MPILRFYTWENSFTIETINEKQNDWYCIGKGICSNCRSKFGAGRWITNKW